MVLLSLQKRKKIFCREKVVLYGDSYIKFIIRYDCYVVEMDFEKRYNDEDFD